MDTATLEKPKHEPIQWLAKARVDKYEGDVTPEQIAAGQAKLIESIEREDNLLLIGGASALWQRLVDGATSVTVFSNANAHLGVGDSTTAEADSQTDLQAATNKLRKAMDATYPQHTDSTSSSAAKTVTFRATFGTSDANFAWQEWGIFNASSAGRMLNRKVTSLGTKTSAATWVFTVTLTLA